MAHYTSQAQALVLRLPEHLEEGVRQRLRDGSMDGVQLTARPDGVEGLREFSLAFWCGCWRSRADCTCTALSCIHISSLNSGLCVEARRAGPDHRRRGLPGAHR